MEELSEVDDEAADSDAAYQQQLLQLQLLQQQRELGGAGNGLATGNPWGSLGGLGGAAAGRRAHPSGGANARLQAARNAALLAGLGDGSLKKGKKAKKAKKKRGSKLEFKRVDQLWDSTIHNYKLTDTAEDEESSEYDQYLFNVRRTFDWEGKYKVCPPLTLDQYFTNRLGNRC